MSNAPHSDRKSDREVEQAAESGKDGVHHACDGLQDRRRAEVGLSMSLFFDAAWFDARLIGRGLDRAALAIAAGLERGELHAVFSNERSATADELETFARVLEADPVEVALRAGVAKRAVADGEEPTNRIESIEARLDAIDSWLAEFERKKRA